MVVSLLLIHFVIALFLAEFVYQDAKENSTQSETTWCVIVLAFGLLGVIAYLLTGQDLKSSGRTEIWRCKECGVEINRDDSFCPDCGTQFERIECEACGESVGMGDTFCPECGNELGEHSAREADSRPKSEPKISVSNSWWCYGVLVGGGSWTLYIVLSVVLPISIETRITWGILIVGWLLVPICLYLDIQYVMANSRWYPKFTFWLAAFTLVPYVNIAIAAGYLYKRNSVLDIPSLDTVKKDIEKLR